ncbi:aldehyde oxidase, putative [Ricinus communis]|uniref:indole-3-acetaldehyde oxidase n=1 Tax=Ricinus communis TaxID=3988 RepID=B9RQ20_RICCO|nr:aldehyde oxidase, putative [Ricinus communis]
MGCGACTVLLSKYDPELDQVEDFTCKYMFNYGLHSIHQRFAGFHASQCGFCTPGMCMSLFGALVNAEKTARPEPSPGFSKLTAIEAEKAIAGNLCRCTGYRPIADVCKSFAADVDMEDLGLNSFWKKGERQEEKIKRLPLYNPNHKIFTFPEFLKREAKSSLLLDPKKRCSWYQPASLQELESLLKITDANNRVRVKLVVGNTGMGYYKETENYDKSIDLRYIPELSMIRVIISKAIEALRERRKDHLEKIATKCVRNTGSIGGNLVMAQRKRFPSDIATVLLAAGSLVYVVSGNNHEKLTLEEFLGRPPLDSKSAKVSRSKSSSKIVSNCCRVAFGAFRTKHAIRARKVEELLTGKFLTIDTLYEAIKVVKALVVPEDGIRNPAYRSSLAVSFLFDFLCPLVNTSSNGWLNEYNGISMFEDIKLKDKPDKIDHFQYPTLLSSSKQAIQLNKEYHPVGEPITKSGASLQASGEAIFVDDIPSPSNCLHGAFIYSTKPFARVKGINFNSKSLPDGVTTLLSFKDIPKGGANVGLVFAFGTEPLFAEELTQFAGERLAFVLADTQKHADVASNLAVVEYDMENLEPPILTVEEVIEGSSLFEVLPVMYPKQVGDVSKGMAEADHKIHSAEIKLGSQYYFYMETQTALAIPDEDNRIVVYTSTQFPESAHITIAKCLGVPENNVRVITRRVGGGFGGKAMKSIPVATACALAAHKLQRPVRIYLNRKTDMIMAGGRHPMKITYSVGFKSNGKITALQLDIMINAGISLDVSPILPQNIISALKKYDWGALGFDIKLCKTNLSSKSVMRAPGEVQGSYIAEAIIEHVASSLSMDVDSVRAINFLTYNSLKLFYGDTGGDPLEFTLTSIWETLGISSNLHQRNEMINEFNRCNVWKKRGISRIPIVFQAMVRPTPGKVSILSDGSIVVEVGGVELGQGLWIKVKQTTAFALSTIKCDGSGDLLDKVRVIQSDTLSLVQGGYTAGSTTSESSSEAVRLCCKILVERLTPLKERLQVQMDSIKWEMLIHRAYLESVSLSVNSYFVPDSASTHYLNYGAAVSEVEIDLLTGQTTILRSDILYDCGQSLNPAVDLGEIEGAFVQGTGFFMLEEYTTNSDGLVDTEGTWTYKIPTIDTISGPFNIELLSSGHHQKRILSSKASGEPPLLLAASVHCATRAAIREARKQLDSWGCLDSSVSTIQVDVPATMPKVKELCGLEIVERYLQWKIGSN